MTGEYFEDPEVTAQGRWRWVAPVVVLLALPAVGILGLRETNGQAFWPSHNSIIDGTAEPLGRAVGTSGSDAQAAVATDADAATIREVETISGQVDGRPLVGRKVELHVPVAAQANDQAFWVGQKDNRILVVPDRDHRDNRERQAGLIADHGIARLEAGQMAAITGTIQKLPSEEQTFSWGLTSDDWAEASGLGVYLRADRVSVQ